ncbi:AraC family transcriptional regulator [Asaia astilbis]|uniref:AraC family transcriptional regulator n=1 Tax=Asaia astilbis TaxID=610244 RepID=UPI000472C2BC|nr:AraC family transcriptional regulator [Asaia astilbis]
MDLLSKVFASVRTRGEIWGRVTLSGRYGIRFPRQHGAFLAVTEGKCWLSLEGEQPLALERGDFVFLPLPSPFYLRSDPTIDETLELEEWQVAHWRATSSLDLGETTSLPFTDDAVSLLVGCFTFPSAEAPLLIRELPALLHGSSRQGESSTRHIMDMMREEIAREAPGAGGIVDRLAEILLMQTIRRSVDAADKSRATGWLRAMSDQKIHAALKVMHGNIACPWTVARIAREIGMSRSAFASRFRERVGQTPLEHLTAWRMARAADLLRHSPSMKTESIAVAVGYKSERAFRAVFAKHMKCPPGAYRRPVASKEHAAAAEV